MSLEQDLVFQEMDNGQDKRHLTDAVNALRNMSISVNPKKIKAALKRYELIQAYSSEDQRKRVLKKKIYARVERFTQEDINKLEDDPEFLSVIKIKDIKWYSNFCPDCGEHNKMRERGAIVEGIKQDKDAVKSTRKIAEWQTFFYYCSSCGNVYDESYSSDGRVLEVRDFLGHKYLSIGWFLNGAREKQ